MFKRPKHRNLICRKRQRRMTQVVCAALLLSHEPPTLVIGRKKTQTKETFFFVICLLAKHRDRRFWTSPFWFSASLLTVSSQINARESLLVVERANIRDRTVTWRTSLPSLCRWHTRVSLDPKDSTHSRLNYGVRAARCLAP
jgi:hypothetical protein